MESRTDITVIGAGIVGISVAYYLKQLSDDLHVTLVDFGQPMALTSAQSGENYRNWWPHPVMKRFTDYSIQLMEDLARETDNRINMTRRGYVLATRSTDIDTLLGELQAGYGSDPDNEIRIHDSDKSGAYAPPLREDWERAPSGVDVLSHRALIEENFPWYDPEIRTLVHIRRAGTISSQQMGQHMLERFRELGGERLQAKVVAIEKKRDFVLMFDAPESKLQTGQIVNAAGPYLKHVAGMLDVPMAVNNVLQQKIAFEDTAGAISRRMPFSIDLDPQKIDWTEEERALLAEDPSLAWVAEEMPGAIHCRPDGGDQGKWIKMGWAYNGTPSLGTPDALSPILDDNFPEIVLRGAARLNPSLKHYYGRLPRNMTHYGGYYTMTDENWPLIGPMGVEGAFVAGALSGFGTMAACATGMLCAKWMLGHDLPDFAVALSLRRYEDAALMGGLRAQQSRGML